MTDITNYYAMVSSAYCISMKTLYLTRNYWHTILSESSPAPLLNNILMLAIVQGTETWLLLLGPFVRTAYNSSSTKVFTSFALAKLYNDLWLPYIHKTEQFMHRCKYLRELDAALHHTVSYCHGPTWIKVY